MQEKITFTARYHEEDYMIFDDHGVTIVQEGELGIISAWLSYEAIQELHDNAIKVLDKKFRK